MPGVVIGQFQELGRLAEPPTEVVLDAFQTAGDVSLGMSEHVADAIERPAGVLP